MRESELNRAARDVIDAGREGVAPNAFTAERIRRAVDRSLAGSAPPARSSKRVTPLLVAFGAAALAGALYATELVRTSNDEPHAPVPTLVLAPPSPRPLVAASPGAPPAPSAEASAVAPAQESARVPSTERASSAPSARSQRLAAEIALLARVNAAVNAGQGARALELLAEYDRTFKPGLLGEERAAASVLALCAAGRTTEARAAAKRFSSRWQRSPLSGRIAKSCAGTE